MIYALYQFISEQYKKIYLVMDFCESGMNVLFLTLNSQTSQWRHNPKNIPRFTGLGSIIF